MIRGERVALQPVRAADLAALYLLISDRSLQGEHLALPPRSEPSFRQEFAETGFLTPQRGRFLVTDLEDRLLGTIVYFSVGAAGGFEIGYHVFDPAFRNQGVMSEGLPLAVGYLFSHHPVKRLQIATAPDNEASRRLALKCGFRLEGTLRGSLLRDGADRDSLVYSLRRGEPSAPVGGMAAGADRSLLCMSGSVANAVRERRARVRQAPLPAG